MVSALSAVHKSMPRISAPICLDNGTTSTLAVIATFMFILDGMWQLQRSLSRENATLWIIANQLFSEMARFS
jgi:hypothetical protein